MNYYKRHLGDYARDTGHLTALEHGIYNLLLDWYYINERPIPQEKAIRIAKGNREETEMVLSEFFVLCDEGWRHGRADREIDDYQRRAEVNRATGKLGGRPRKTDSVSERNPNVTLATSHKPLANTTAEAKATVQQAAQRPSRFADFWKSYPNKQGKAAAEKKWRAMKLDPKADEIIAHVHHMKAHDDGWQRGFIPMGSTYINGQRWTDEPKGPTTDAKREPSKQMQALNNLQEMRNGLAGGRGNGGFPAFGLLGDGSAASGRGNSGNGNGLV